jgi:hypothetical protein
VNLNKKTFVIIENAPVHKNKAFMPAYPNGPRRTCTLEVIPIYCGTCRGSASIGGVSHLDAEIACDAYQIELGAVRHIINLPHCHIGHI